MESLLPLAGFAFVSSITPGPNNVMLSASGVAFGMRRTLPHMFGVALGFLLLLIVCGGGIGALVIRFPALGLALKTVGTLYLLYLAWAMRNALVPQARLSSGRPLKFREGVMFQFVNPKAWIMALTAVSVFVPNIEPRWAAVGLVCIVFTLINLPCICTWALLGVTVRRWLSHERWRLMFSGLIVVLMIYSVIAMWL